MRRPNPLAATLALSTFVALAGCNPGPGASAPPAEAPPAATVEPASDAPRRAQPSPGPSSPGASSPATAAGPASPAEVPWDQKALSLERSLQEGLPALSDDGTRVALAWSAPDGARGNPNLALWVLETERGTIDEVVTVIDAENPEAPGADERFAKAKAVLARRHWEPLASLLVDIDLSSPTRRSPTGEEAKSMWARGGGLAVRFREPWLEVSDEKGRSLLRRSVPSWSARSGPRCPGCVDCPRPLAELTSAFGLPERGVLVLVVGYRGGTDMCWEPDETPHVVTLPRRK